MSEYRTIIVAVDLTEDCPTIVNRARLLSAAPDVRILLVHVLESVALAYGGDIPMDMSEIQNHIKERSESQMKKVAAQFSIPDYECRVLSGHPEAELDQLAREENADLIVVGCHSKTGLKVLFGGTANSLLNTSPCDVLAVRVTG